MRFSRLVSLISLTIFSALGLVIVSSWATRHAIGGGTRFSDGGKKFILTLSDLPRKTKSVLGLFNHYFSPNGLFDKYAAFRVESVQTNKLAGYILVSALSSNGLNHVSLLNLSNGSNSIIISPNEIKNSDNYSDRSVGCDSRRQSPFSSRQRVWHPHISRDGVLTYGIPWNDIVSINLKTGKEQWRVYGAFHHSIESDNRGNLWVCGAADPGSLEKSRIDLNHSNKSFQDQTLVKISPSGRILDVISIADLLCKAGLEYLLYGVSNPDSNFDPIHLNQVTPIISDAGIFKTGQLLVSLRNLSTIILVDPDKKSIVWHRVGPWMNQHCALPVGKSTFSILDNHSFASGKYWLDPKWQTQILIHNIELEETEVVFWKKSTKDHFIIPIEGRASAIFAPLEGWLIEDSVQGTIMIYQNQNLVFKWSNIYPDGSVGNLSWCRYLSENQVPDFLKEN